MRIACDGVSAIYWRHATTSLAVPTEVAGRAGVGHAVAGRSAASAGGTSGDGPPAVGPWDQRARGSELGSANPAGHPPHCPSVPPGRLGQRAVRAPAPGTRRDSRRGGEATDCCHGLQRSPAGGGAMDGAADRAGGRETKNGAARGTRDDSRTLTVPRPKAVAGKKCGAWLS